MDQSERADEESSHVQPPVSGFDDVRDVSRQLDRFKAFIGPNWDSHYKWSFERQSHGAAGWTWNWAGALIPVWFWYRRLYLALFGFIALYLVIRALDNAVAGSPEGGSMVALLFLGQVLLQGWAADRLLYLRAQRLAARNLPSNELAALGRPNRWAIRIPIIVVVVGILSAILIPMFAGR